MSENTHTKEQIRSWLERAVKNAQNPNSREKIKRLRKAKAEKVKTRYGF